MSSQPVSKELTLWSTLRIPQGYNHSQQLMWFEGRYESGTPMNAYNLPIVFNRNNRINKKNRTEIVKLLRDRNPETSIGLHSMVSPIQLPKGRHFRIQLNMGREIFLFQRDTFVRFTLYGRVSKTPP